MLYLLSMEKSSYVEIFTCWTEFYYWNQNFKTFSRSTTDFFHHFTVVILTRRVFGYSVPNYITYFSQICTGFFEEKSCDALYEWNDIFFILVNGSDLQSNSYIYITYSWDFMRFPKFSLYSQDSYGIPRISMEFPGFQGFPSYSQGFGIPGIRRFPLAKSSPNNISTPCIASPVQPKLTIHRFHHQKHSFQSAGRSIEDNWCLQIKVANFLSHTCRCFISSMKGTSSS